MTKIEDVIASVARRFRVPRALVVGRDRLGTPRDLRMLAAWLCRQIPHPTPSYPEIGRAFGRRDHRTIMSIVSRFDLAAWRVHVEELAEELSLPVPARAAGLRTRRRRAKR